MISCMYVISGQSLPNLPFKISSSKASPDACTIQSSFSPSLPLSNVFPMPNLDKLCCSATHKLSTAVHTGLLKSYLFMRADCSGCGNVRKTGWLAEKPFLFLFQQAALNPGWAFCPPPRKNKMQFCLHCREAVDQPQWPVMITHHYHQPLLQKRRWLQPIPQGKRS